MTYHKKCDLVLEKRKYRIFWKLRQTLISSQSILIDAQFPETKINCIIETSAAIQANKLKWNKERWLIIRSVILVHFVYNSSTEKIKHIINHIKYSVNIWALLILLHICIRHNNKTTIDDSKIKHVKNQQKCIANKMCNKSVKSARQKLLNSFMHKAVSETKRTLQMQHKIRRKEPQ